MSSYTYDFRFASDGMIDSLFDSTVVIYDILIITN